MATETRKEKTWQDCLAAWNSHDWDKVFPFYADDCIYEDMGGGKVSHGKPEVKAYFHDMLVWSADFKMESKSFFTIGNWMAGEWVMTGTHTGDVPGMKATGKKYSIRGASVCELRKGKIRRETDYWNLASFLQQVGLMPGQPK
jgi:steroid delta-isomerase-like uncharacterized protein